MEPRYSILYLMHMVPDLNMSEIYMITFTNEATNQMNDKLQEKLLSLTKNKRYLSWLEQQSQMHISTIECLAYDLIKRFGTGVGFGRDLEIQPMEKDRKDLNKDILSDCFNERKSIVKQIGMSYSEASRLIDAYWRELTRKGYTIDEILAKDWGNADREPLVASFQNVLCAILEQFEEKYGPLKLDANAISINDLFFDFGHYLLDKRLDCNGLDMRYLFVDEFQDTDATQIRTFASLAQTIGARLFVVGDVKQSIYAFKGATDEAFDILEAEMKGNLRYYSLRNNYRTCSNIMKIMEKYFFAWSKEGLVSLVGVSFIATLLNYFTGGAFGRKWFMTYHSALLSPITWVRAFTHILGHADWTHLAGNMSYLLLLGPMLEEKYSSQTLAGVVAITAVVTSIVNYIFFPGVGLCGASGVVFAFILLSSFTGFKEREIPLTFILVAVSFIGQQVYEGLTIQDNVSNMAHIVGGIVGSLLGYGLNKATRL